jgi:hypothetical protein
MFSMLSLMFGKVTSPCYAKAKILWLNIRALQTVWSTWLQLTETLGANTESQNKRRCDRVPLVGGNAVPQRYWICSRSSQVLAERRDQISNGVITEAGTSLCTQPDDNRFDRATQRAGGRNETSLTERVRRNYTGQSSKDFPCVL